MCTQVPLLCIPYKVFNISHGLIMFHTSHLLQNGGKIKRHTNQEDQDKGTLGNDT